MKKSIGVRIFGDDRQTAKTWGERETGFRRPIKKRTKIRKGSGYF